MKKLSLNPDSLRVRSFVTGDEAGARDGTVHGLEDTLPTEINCTKTTCPSRNCPTQPPQC